MGVFDRFPYTNFHELNLDWILHTLRELDTEITQFVSINALKYADPIQWNITTQYEKNTIVIDPLTGTAYISVQPVPAGVAITNTDYWTVVFDLGSFVVRAAKNFTNKFEEETTLTATFPSNVNDWIIWGDTLYNVISPIVAGDQYVDGSNIVHFTIESVVGHIQDLNTTDKSNLVAAINEVLTTLINTAGDLDNLTTTDKSNLVAAINEVLATLTATTGDLSNLTTTDKSNLVAAINEVKTYYDNIRVYNVIDYGADPTGATDCSSIVQDILDNTAGNNIVVYFPAGYYRIDTTIDVPRGGIAFIGCSPIASQIRSHVVGPIFQFDCTSTRFDFIQFRNIALYWYDTSAANTGSIGIKVTGTSSTITYFNQAIVDNIISAGLETFFYCDKYNSGSSEIGFNFNIFSKIVTTNHGSNLTKYGFYFNSGSGTGNIFTDSAIHATTYGMLWTTNGLATNIGDILINTIQFAGVGTSTGIVVYGVDAVYHSQMVISNCQFDAGISRAFSVNTMDNLTVTSCNLTNLEEYDLYNVTEMKIEYGNPIHSTFDVVDKRTVSTKEFGYIRCWNPCHYKIFIHGNVQGVGDRYAYVEGVTTYSGTLNPIATLIPDSTNFNPSVVQTSNTDGSYNIKIDLNHAAANDLPIYCHLEVDCKRVLPMIKSHHS